VVHTGQYASIYLHVKNLKYAFDEQPWALPDAEGVIHAEVVKVIQIRAARPAQTALDSVPKGTEDLNMKALRKGYDYGREQSTPIS